MFLPFNQVFILIFSFKYKFIRISYFFCTSSLIKKLGKNPCFVNSKGIIWNSGNLNYDVKDIIKTMEYNIKTEKVAIDRI